MLGFGRARHRWRSATRSIADALRSALSSGTLPLTGRQIEQFVRDGFVRLDGAFPRSVAEDGCRLLWAEMGLDAEDRSTWQRPAVRLPGSNAPPFVRAANAPMLRAAYDQLVGRGGWRRTTNRGLGDFLIRFPSPADPGDACWHVDGGYWVDGQLHVNLGSRERALTQLFLLSDVGPADAPTRLLAGSHLDVVPVLRAVGPAGIRAEEIMAKLGALDGRRVSLATGRAGDVYLCHPFLVHAPSWPHRGATPRFLAQPPVIPVGELTLERPGGDYSPVELAVRLGLGLGPAAPPIG